MQLNYLKNSLYMTKIMENLWNISPIFIFMLFLLIMNFYFIKMENNNTMMNLSMLILIIGLTIFPLFWSSFFSMSKFSFISAKRCITQMISYELGLMFMLILLFPICFSLNMEEMIKMLNNYNYLKYLMIMFSYLLILSESSRIPFDFIEGESELVSGFNIEYSSCYFSLFFIYEYGMMLFFSIFFSFFFFNYFISMFLIFMFIILRASFPRLRYDQMMNFFWKNFYFLLISFMMILK